MRRHNYALIKETITSFLKNVESNIDKDSIIDSVTINYQAGHYECEVIISKEGKSDPNKSNVVLIPKRRIRMTK